MLVNVYRANFDQSEPVNYVLQYWQSKMYKYKLIIAFIFLKVKPQNDDQNTKWFLFNINTRPAL